MTHPLVKKVRTFSDEHALITKGSSLIIGLSGGPDSVALLSLLKKLEPVYGYSLIAAHLDHQWRAASHKDVAFCKNFAASLEVPFVHATADQISLTKKAHSLEEKGRLLRRSYFEDLLKTYDAHSIALGHHYQDQQETFFLRMMRGASVAGLAGMKPKQDAYIRPLLTCSKDELLGYLKDEQLPFLTDETNENPRFLRNAIRLKVIPALKTCDDRFDRSFQKTIQSLQETDAYLERVAQTLLTSLTNGSHALAIDEFLATDKFLHHRILIQWLCKEKVPFIPSTALFDELTRFMSNSAREHKVHPAWKLVKSGPYITIEKAS